MGKNFKPEEFGFNMSYSRRASGGSATRGCYVTMDEPKKKLQLVIDMATTERLREIAGDRVSFGMDKKGRILVTAAGDSFGRKLSKASSTSCKSQVSMGSMYGAYRECMGTFKRLYLTAEVYHGGDAIIFTPNGTVDKV